MATYAKKSYTVEAVQFTSTLGDEIREATMAAGAKGESCAHESGITYEEGRGYRFRGHTLGFNNYLVTRAGVTTVSSKDEFEGKYEPKREVAAAPIAEPEAAPAKNKGGKP
jgi:hypothetical protein